MTTNETNLIDARLEALVDYPGYLTTHEKADVARMLANGVPGSYKQACKSVAWYEKQAITSQRKA